MLLEADVPLGIAAVVRVRGELAFLDARLPVRTAELVLNDLDAVEPVLYVVPVQRETERVPLTRGFHDVSGRRIQPVVRSGRGEARLAVGMPGVVEDLHLRSTPVNGVVVLARPVEDAAVAIRGDLPFERQLEVLELLGGDDVGRPADPRERAVHHLPSRWQGVHLPPPPAGSGLAVEQKPPPGGALGGRERVERRLRAGGGRQRHDKAGHEQGYSRWLFHVGSRDGGKPGSTLRPTASQGKLVATETISRAGLRPP